MPKLVWSVAGWSIGQTTSMYCPFFNGAVKFLVPKRGCIPPSINGEPSPTSTDVSTVVLKDVSKKTVKNSSECMSYESTYTSTNGAGADLETWTSTDKTTCTIKK